ncbi:MAG TPA: Hint domain-containing protein [Nannocystis sp.]|jgi:hypothetical protein
MHRTYGTATCIAAGTKVTTADGQIPIDMIEILDELLTLDPERGLLIPARVIAVRRAERECVCLHLPGGTLRLTSDHPVWSPETCRYEAAGLWVTGHLQLLTCLAGDRAGLTVVTARESFVGVLPVLDLVLAAPQHSFLASQVLVHS